MRLEEKLKLVKEDVLKHGFQALFIKDWDGRRGKSWQLSSCASDCACSPACMNCPVVLLQLKRGMGSGAQKKVKATFLRQNLLEPLGWDKRHMVFVCPQGDLFHHDISDENIAEVFAVMSVRKQDCYLVLTKRAERLKSVLCSPSFADRVQMAGRTLLGSSFELDGEWGRNMLVGVSVEDQEHMKRADVLPDLPRSMGKALFAAPLLGEVTIPTRVLKSLDWVVCNRERGGTYCNPRPCDVEWIKALKWQCLDAGVPIFVEDRWTETLNGALLGVPREYPTILAR
jgi:protein gp37